MSFVIAIQNKNGTVVYLAAPRRCNEEGDPVRRFVSNPEKATKMEDLGWAQLIEWLWKGNGDGRPSCIVEVKGEQQ